MTRVRIARASFVTALVLLAAALVVLAVVAITASQRVLVQAGEPDPPTAPAILPPSPATALATAPQESYQGFLYGRISTVDGATYEGRLRWGGDEEAFWGDTLNGVKSENPWLADVSPERLPRESRPVTIFGVTIARNENPIDTTRPFMARLGDIARIAARGSDVQVTLKSGTVFDLDRFAASDFDDGVRVWDGRRGIVDLDSLRIRTIELLATAPLGAVPGRLHGTVRTRQGDFTGFLQWNRQEGVGSDELDGESAEGEIGLRFDTLRSIARRSRDRSLVTMLDGREIVLSGTGEVGHGNRGVYVDDRRYGRVLVSWEAFERLDFTAGPPGTPGTAADTGPAYGSFPPGRPLTGSVTTRAGRHLAGRLVYDLDESETTETLDAQSQGVDYSILFGRIAAVVPLEPDADGARVTLLDGEELELKGSADVDRRHAGVLVFAREGEGPEYVRWEEVRRIEFDRPPALAPPLR